MFLTDDVTKELTTKHQKELNDLSKMFTDKFNQQLKAIQSRDEQLQQQGRQLELLTREVRSNSVASTSGKRPRIHSDKTANRKRTGMNILNLP